MHWADTTHFISKLSPRKIFNATQVLSSFYWTKWTSRPTQWGKPFTLSFEPTTACNLNCPECPSGLKAFTRDTGNLKWNFFKEVIDQVHRDLMYLIFYFQGEPYINPDFLKMVEYAHRKNIYTISSTNGHFLNDENSRKTVESGLDRLIISIDGATQEVYQQYRVNGDLDKVIQGARNIVKWKKKLNSSKPHTIFQFLVVKPNEHQINEVKSLAREIGIDEIKFKTAQVYDYENGNPLIPDQDKYSRYRKLENGKYAIKNSLSNFCWKLWHASVITWDGLILPCCFDKDAQHVLGDLKSQSFSTVWKNGKYSAFRNKITTGRNQIDICTNCSEGCQVWTKA